MRTFEDEKGALGGRLSRTTQVLVPGAGSSGGGWLGFERSMLRPEKLWVVGPGKSADQVLATGFGCHLTGVPGAALTASDSPLRRRPSGPGERITKWQCSPSGTPCWRGLLSEHVLAGASANGRLGRRDRSEPMRVQTPRGPVDVVRQRWRSQRPGSRGEWEWLARRGGQRDWKQGSTAHEAIRRATLLAPGKQPGLADRGGRRGRARADRPGSPATSRSASERGRRMNYARRQQYRRLSRAARPAGSVAAVLLALVVASAGAPPLAGLLLLVAVGLGLDARRWLALAGRNRVGARSEDDVQRALAPLEAEGWRLRHSLRGRVGDIDSVAISPTGIAVAIETKTRTYDAAISPGFASRRCGCHDADEGGHGMAPLASCASFVRAALSASNTTFWWSRSTA